MPLAAPPGGRFLPRSRKPPPIASPPAGRKPAPLGATKRWVAERTNSWHNAHKKLEGVHRKARESHRLLGDLDALPLIKPTFPPIMTHWRKLLTTPGATPPQADTKGSFGIEGKLLRAFRKLF